MEKDLHDYLWQLEHECEAFMKHIQKRLKWLDETADRCASETGYTRAYSEIMQTLQKEFPLIASMIRGGRLD